MGALQLVRERSATPGESTLAAQLVLFPLPPEAQTQAMGKRPKKKLPKFLNAREQGALEAEAVKESPKALALVLCTFRAGLRVSEACRLRWKDVEAPWLLVEQGKGGKDRVVPLHGRLEAALERVRISYKKQTHTRGGAFPLDSGFRRNDGAEWVFPGRKPGSHLSVSAVQKLFRRLGDRAGLPAEKCHPHAGRHGFAVALVEKNTSMREIQQLLGHASLNTTMVYLDLTPEHLRKAVDRLD